ncbi:hypothetical protein K1719_004379 [Acacia pycnantha]|nr:hypothetical protein K1719_004379 [Acacia pycnantha]
MLSIGHSITNKVLKENLQNTMSLLIDKTANTLNSTSTSQSANHRLGNTLNVIVKNLPVPLGSSLAQTLASLPTTRRFHRESDRDPRAMH